MEGTITPKRRVCGARTRTGGICQKPPAVGRTRCRLHGGASLVGVASGTYRTGRHSRYVPHNIRGMYEEASRDPDLLALNEELVLLDSRINSVLNQIDAGEAGHWRQVRQAWRTFKAARSRGDTLGMTEALEALGEAIDRGAAEAAAWSEIADLVERRRRLVETEQKRRVAMQTMITAERLDLVLGVVVAAVEKHVTDERALAGISAELAKVIADREVA